MDLAWILLTGSGLGAGLLAGFLGIGGGVVVVPLLLAFGYEPKQAIATSILAITITALSGTIQNWRMGYIHPQRVIALGLPAFISAQLGVYLANQAPSRLLLIGFALLLLLNIYLMELRRRLLRGQPVMQRTQWTTNPLVARLATGGTAGILAGLFGVGGGVIMVPLQILWLGEPIKVAIQTSLGVIVITALSACLSHALSGNVLLTEGILLGLGGIVGAQISTRFLPQLPDRVISLAFRMLLLLLALYTFWRAWNS